ncbi:MAG: NAD-dependent epimerase/dehydratase family protein [Verrucomicrobiota bacterium]
MSVCLITGGAGNLACQLSWTLAEKFERILLFDRATAPTGKISPVSEFVQGDLLNEQQIVELFKEHKPTAVIHLASLLSGSCEQDRSLAWNVNMDGTFSLFETALRHGMPKVLFASSVAAFGGPLPDVLTDDTPQWPETLYGVTKMAVERLGCYYHKRHGLDFRCIRLPITISRHAPRGAASALVSHAFIEAVHSGKFVFAARPETKLAAIYVRDLLRGFGDLLSAPESTLTRRVYNIGGFSTTPDEIAAAIKNRLPQASLEFCPDDAVDSVLRAWPGTIDDSAARQDWQWRPEWNIDRTADDFLTLLKAETHTK